MSWQSGTKRGTKAYRLHRIELEPRRPRWAAVCSPLGHWILRFSRSVARRGESGRVRSCQVNALAYSRFPSVLGALGALILLLVDVPAWGDKIRLRDGHSMTGKILMVKSDGYVFRENTPPRLMQTIPKAAVQTVHYDNPAQANKALGIKTALRHIKGASSPIRLLPTRPFGQSILKAVQAAKSSIWVSAYYISGSSTSPIKDFYATLQEKAKQGLDVIIVSEYGPGTSARVRESTFNFARELESSGIRVLFVTERRILHKKMILIDGQIALLGSSNLTMAGTLQSDEMNVEIRQPKFVAQMQKDFERIIARAHTAELIQSKEKK